MDCKWLGLMTPWPAGLQPRLLCVAQLCFVEDELMSIITLTERPVDMFTDEQWDSIVENTPRVKVMSEVRLKKLMSRGAIIFIYEEEEE